MCQGFENMAYMGSVVPSVEGLMLRAQMAESVNNYITNVPNMSASEIGYDIGFGLEKTGEGILLSKGAGLAGNAIKGAQLEMSIARGVNLVDDAAGVISKGDYLRIQNAATRINKPISVVGSRARGSAGAYSDWDYVIQGGLKNSREWSKIKNSLPGARSVFDNTPRNIDILPGPVWQGSPQITIYPR